MIKERADTTKDIYIIAYFIFIIYKNTYLCNRKYYIMVSALYFNLEIKYTHTHIKCHGNSKEETTSSFRTVGEGKVVYRWLHVPWGRGELRNEKTGKRIFHSRYHTLNREARKQTKYIHSFKNTKIKQHKPWGSYNVLCTGNRTVKKKPALLSWYWQSRNGLQTGNSGFERGYMEGRREN